MSNLKNRINFTVLALFAFAALMAGLFTAQYFPLKKTLDRQQFHGTLLSKPREISAFSFTGIDNEDFTNASLRGQWTMVFFGFTNCGYMCPTTMAQLGKMYRQLTEKKINPLPNVVLITLDPERDNLETLSHYVKAFDPHFYAARGSEEEVKLMAEEIGVAYAKVSLPRTAASQGYDIQHSGAILLFNPQGELIAFFTNPHEALLLAQDYQMLVS